MASTNPQPPTTIDWEAKYVKLQWAAIDLIKEMEGLTHQIGVYSGSSLTVDAHVLQLRDIVFPRPTPAQEALEALNAYDNMIEDGKPPSLDILLDAISQVKEGRRS